jgi:hypothetical protein
MSHNWKSILAGYKQSFFGPFVCIHPRLDFRLCDVMTFSDHCHSEKQTHENYNIIESSTAKLPEKRLKVNLLSEP